MTWRAKFSIGVPLGLAFVALILTLDGWLLHRLVYRDIALEKITFLTFLAGLVLLLSLPLLAIVAYQTLSCLTLRYRLDRNGLVIRWLGSALVIPIRSLQRIISGGQLGGAVVRRRGLHWPGHERGEGAVPGIGRTRFLATRPLGGQLLLVTPGQAVAISPSDPTAFLEAYQSRQALGPNRLLEPGQRSASWLGWDLWTNRTAWLLLGTALVINLGLFAFLCARYPRLDVQLPLHFNSLGQPDRIGTKSELFALPIIGLIILTTNLLLGVVLYRWERAGSYLLWGTAAAAQLLFWLAAFSIV
jgi:hypothetical protein